MIFPSPMGKGLLLVWLGLISLTTLGQEIPKLSGDKLVYDFADLLKEPERDRLEFKLRAFEDTTSNEIVIAIVKDLLGYPVNDYAIRIAEESGIGKANNDNGILVLVAPDEREMSIEVGYGLEAAIPDGVAGTIIRDYITPYFKNEDYYRGLDEGTNMLMKLASGEINKDMVGASGKDKDFPWGFLIPIGIIILFGVLGNRRRNRYTDIDGRGYRSTGPMWWGGGLGGGRSSGGSSFGGGGGFGGFGGGSFGGGGASGGW